MCKRFLEAGRDFEAGNGGGAPQVFFAMVLKVCSHFNAGAAAVLKWYW